MRHMAKSKKESAARPLSESLLELPELPPVHRVDTPGGPIHVRWEADSEVTAHGSLTYFLVFLKTRVFWGWLHVRPKSEWPALLRGDIAHGSERMMKEAEARGVPYLFKLKRSPGVEKLIAELVARGEKTGWRQAGGRWKGVDSSLRFEKHPQRSSDHKAHVFARHWPQDSQ